MKTRIVTGLFILLALTLFVLAVATMNAQQGYIHGNGDPRVTGRDCGASRFYIDDTTNQMYEAGAGSPCVWTVPGSGSGGGLPGWTSTGSGTSQVDTAPGTLAATAMSLNGALPGTVIKADGSGPSYANNYFSVNGLNMFGDSITAMYGAASNCNFYFGTNVGCGYSNILRSKFGDPFTNYGVSGISASDAVNTYIYPNLNPTHSGNVPSTLMIGTNDGNCGASVGCQNNYTAEITSGITWGVVPYEFKIQPQLGITSGNCTTTGTWTNVAVGNNLAVQSIVPGSTITCTSLTQGDAVVYGNWLAVNGRTSTATFAIDAVTVDTWNGFGFNGQIVFGQSVTQSPFGARYALTGNGSHTYKVTVGTAGAGNAFTFLWAGSPMPKTAVSLGGQSANPPRMAVSGVIRRQADCTNNLSTASGIYNSLALAIANQLQADGNFVIPVDVRKYVGLDCSTLDSDMLAATLPNGLVTAAGSSGVHPGGQLYNGVMVGGHPHIADAFLAAMPPPPPAVSPIATSLALNYTVQASNYTVQQTDGIIYMTGPGGTTVTLPLFTKQVGPITIVNATSGQIVIAGGTGITGMNQIVPIPQNKMESVANYNLGNNWQMVMPPQAGPTSLTLGQLVVSSNHTIASTDSVLLVACGTACTLTFPNLGIIGPIFIINYGSTAVTLSGSISNSPGTLAPGQGAIFVGYTSGPWFTTAFYGAGITKTCSTAITAMTVTNGVISSLTCP